MRIQEQANEEQEEEGKGKKRDKPWAFRVLSRSRKPDSEGR